MKQAVEATLQNCSALPEKADHMHGVGCRDPTASHRSDMHNTHETDEETPPVEYDLQKKECHITAVALNPLVSVN